MWNELAIDASVNAWLSTLPCDKLATCPQQEIHFACRQLPEAPAAQMTEVLEGGVLVVLAGWGQRRLAEIAVLGEVVNYGSMLCWSWRSKVSVLRGHPTNWNYLLIFLSEPARFGRFLHNWLAAKKETHRGATSSYRAPSSRWWFRICS